MSISTFVHGLPVADLIEVADTQSMAGSAVRCAGIDTAI